ncbi:MAG TPA: hypothetical protein VGD78_15770 [Chthoniobacterales bacterium]
MSPHNVPRSEKFDGKHLSRILLILLCVGGLSLLASLLIGFIAPAGSPLRHQFAFSWLFAFFYFFTLLIGSLFWILVHHATDSGWGVLVRRQMENLAVQLPWMALFFLPLFIFRRDLWTWITVKDQVHVDPNLLAKLPYFELHLGGMTVPFFWVRAVFYFLFFGGAALYFRRTSLRQDADGDPKWTVRMRGVSFVCLLLFALCTTFAAFDWLASLDYHWASTMWGVYIFAGAAGAAMALLILVILGLKGAGYLAAVNQEHYHMMGKLLLTFSIFWGYIGFSQYMLIWYGNIPEETQWFLRRNVESWNVLSTAMVVGRFFVPFLYLLFQFTKRSPRFLSFICVWVLAMHVLDTYITVLPFVHPTGFEINILDLLCLFAIGCPLAVLFLRTIGTVPLFPARDPRLLESVNLSN